MYYCKSLQITASTEQERVGLEGFGSGGRPNLVWWQRGEGLDDGGQGHLRLLGHVGRARHVVSGAAHKPGTGIP